MPRRVATGLLALTLASCGGGSTAVVAPIATIPASDSAPSWSPDGTRIAYAHAPGSEESAARAGIYVVDAQGGTPVQILAGAYTYPHWSPDGRHLVVSGGGVYTMTATGDSLTRISAAQGYAAKWSPDGQTIAYQTYDDRQVYRLWLMARDGSNVRCMNSTGSTSWFEPTWSADGGYVIHVRWGVYVAKPQMFRMDPNGFDEMQLTFDAAEVRTPACSPDGRSVAWSSWRGDTAQIWLSGADGQGARRLTNGLWPVWSPDSRSIAFTAADAWNGAYRLTTIDCVTGARRTLAH